MDIPKEFKAYWYSHKRKDYGIMTLEEMWAMWEPYWHLRHNGPSSLPKGEQYVLGRYGDQGGYTVGNCRIITHRANTLERDHKKCADKLRGTVNNPQGGRTVAKHRRNGVAPIVTPRGEYPNCAEAARAYGMHRSSMWHRVKSEAYPGFYWRNF